MGVGEHLRIELEEYDQRIRTFVPWYDDLLRMTAESLLHISAVEPTIVDLGVGTGALAAACLEVRPEGGVVGLDTDPGVLAVARTRLAGFQRVELVEADFLVADLPPCDAIVACISLHHVRTGEAKQAIYRRCHEALQPGGVMVSADCFPAREHRVAVLHREQWFAHLEKSCSRAEAEAHLESWAGEDVYFPLEAELDWMRQAGFATEVLWRMEGFAVIAAFRDRLDGGRKHG